MNSKVEKSELELLKEENEALKKKMNVSEKVSKNPHLAGKKRIKVQALRDGFFGNSKVIEGEVFVIKEKDGLKRVSKYSDYTEARVVTVAEQFSKYWMVEVEGADDDHILRNEELKDKRAVEDKIRARDSEESEATLTKKPVVKKAPKKAEKKPEPNADSEVVI